MDIRHPGNWKIVGRLTINGAEDPMAVFECPICFALTREPMDHADHHLKFRQAWTQPPPAAARVRQVGQQQ